MYLTGIESTDSATTCAFMIHLYIPDSTPEDIANTIAAQLEDMHIQGIQTSPAQLQTTMTVDSFTNTHTTPPSSTTSPLRPAPTYPRSTSKEPLTHT